MFLYFQREWKAGHLGRHLGISRHDDAGRQPRIVDNFRLKRISQYYKKKIPRAFRKYLILLVLRDCTVLKLLRGTTYRC